MDIAQGMDRRWFLRMAGVSVGTLAIGTWVRMVQGAAVQRPNFIFIFADDLGWGDLSCYGNRQIRTPNLDRLAKQGTLFTQFYVNGSVCSPSRTAFMTGQNPARLRMHGHLARPEQNKQRAMPNWLDAKVPCVPRLLKQAGYATGHFGKWHLGSGKGAPSPKEYGIDDFGVMYEWDHVRPRPNKNPDAEKRSDPYWRAKSTGYIVDEGIRFLEENQEKPFYLQLWTYLTHATLHPTEEQMEPYKRFAPKGVPYHGAKKIYYASVTELDSQIGRLLKKLDEMGLAENTVVAFSSDNGPEDFDIGNAVHSGIGSAGPFRGRKRSLYEGGVRMPYIMRWPGHIPAGKVNNDSILAGVDWLPTVSKLAGVKLPKDIKLDGEDMSQVWLGTHKERNKPLMWEWRFKVFGEWVHRCPMLSIREGKWKLLMNPDRSRIELYDIPNDPTELDNLADEHPGVVKRLSEKVLAWQQELPKGPVEKVAGSNAYPWPTGK